MFAFFDQKKLLQLEKEVRNQVNQANYETRRRRELANQEALAEKARQKIEKKKNLKVANNIRMMVRSKRPDFMVTTNDTETTPPEVEEMRRYLGQMTEQWEAEMFKSSHL